LPHLFETEALENSHCAGVPEICLSGGFVASSNLAGLTMFTGRNDSAGRPEQYERISFIIIVDASP
jgi:hypothetical protein